MTGFYMKHRVNPFLVNIPILCPMNSPENQRFSGEFRGHKMGILVRNGSIEEYNRHATKQTHDFDS